LPEVFGAIGDKWKKLGGAGSLIGNPITGEEPTSDGIGRRQKFEKLNGMIYWHPKTGANCVLGLIGHRWLEIGAENFGYPITDETPTSDGVGRFNHFRAFNQNGQTSDSSIFWHPSTAAFEIYGAIRDRWASMGWEKSNLGYPTRQEVKLLSLHSLPGTQHIRRRTQSFQRGSLIYNSLTGQILTSTVLGTKFILTFDSGFVPTDIHLGGSYKIVLNSAGESTFSGRFHNSGATNIDYILVAVIMTPSGIGYTFTHKGHTDGDLEIGGDNNDNFVITGFNTQIKDSWKEVGLAALVGRVEASDTLLGGINDLLEDLAKEGVKKLVMGAVSYVLIGVI
jgi:hypothetical protein